MRWLSALLMKTRNGIGAFDTSLISRIEQRRSRIEHFGIVPIAGHGGLSGRELASAGASIARSPDFVTFDDVREAGERMEAFVERAAADVQSRDLRGDYAGLQGAEVDVNEEAEALGAAMERVGRVEGAAVVGWVIRNAAIRSQRPIARLVGAGTADVSVDLQEMAGPVGSGRLV